MADSTRHETTRTINAPAARIFALISDPQGHVDIDGSGMLVAAVDSHPVTAVGDTFVMDMDREPLGDIPEMGKYQVNNVVTQFVPDTLFEWTVGTVGRNTFGHVYGYRLEPGPDAGSTVVTSYCDWSGVDPKHQHRFPVVPLTSMEASLERVDRLVTEGAA